MESTITKINTIIQQIYHIITYLENADNELNMAYSTYNDDPAYYTDHDTFVCSQKVIRLETELNYLLDKILNLCSQLIV